MRVYFLQHHEKQRSSFNYGHMHCEVLSETSTDGEVVGTTKNVVGEFQWLENQQGELG